jgi:hypothetical protein
MSSKFSRKPKAADPKAVEDFISAAGQPAGAAIDMKPSDTVSYDTASSHIIANNTESFPWLDPRIRDDVQKVYNLRLPEAYLLKLKYIAEHTPDSMHKFCLDTLLPAIDAKVEQLIKR